MAKAKVTIIGQTYPPKEDYATIDLYITNKPIKEYIEFAKIKCADTNDKWCIEQLSKKAREIGADGIIIIGKAGTTGGSVPIGNTYTYVSTSGYGMEAIAIKYKE